MTKYRVVTSTDTARYETVTTDEFDNGAPGLVCGMAGELQTLGVRTDGGVIIPWHAVLRLDPIGSGQ